jgi:prepilin-type processing-associated H-X9-DG protein
VRVAAARTQSANNLKQMALAAHNYHDVNGHLPPGVDGKGFSAAAYLLPYIEQDNLFKTIDFKKPPDDKANAVARQAVIKTFLSPLDAQTSVTADSGATNYLYNAGSKYDLEDNDGVFYRDSKVKLAEIKDGTSNTMLAAETLKGDNGMRALDVHRQHVRLKKGDLKGLTAEAGVKEWKADRHIAADRCAAWIDGAFLRGTFTAARRINDPRPDVDCAGAGGLSGPRTFIRGVNVAMCDGSVRFIVSGVSLDTLKAISTRDAGDVPGSDF